MRTMWRPWRLAGLLVASLILTSSALVANPGPAVRVNAVVRDGAVRLEARSNTPFEYTTYRPSENLFVVDLTGVTTSDLGETRVLDSDLVSSYRLSQFKTAQKSIVRLEVLLRTTVEPHLERSNPQELILIVARPAAATGARESTSPVAKPVAAPAAAAKPMPASAPVSKSVAVPAPVAKPAQSTLAIEAIRLGQNGSKTEVHVAGSGHLTYQVLRLNHPERLVLDFTGAHLETPSKPVSSGTSPVRSIRAAQFAPKVARVVIDLEHAASYEINAVGNEITVAFSPAGNAPAARKPDAKPVTPKTKIEPELEHKAVVKNEAAQIKPSRETGQTLALPANLTQPTAALASPAAARPQSSIPPASDSASTTAAPAANSNPSSPASAQPSAPARSEPSKEIQAPANAPAGSTKYSGEPISVNLKDVDLKDFFRLIHEISGLNVVVDPSVKGSLTTVLDEVPWDQALDIVLKNFGLDKQLDGNVLRIATKATLKREAEEQRDLVKAQSEAIETVTTTRVLSYAKASDMKDTFKKFLSPRGEILADERSNTLIIRDIPNVIPVIDNLIRQLDRKSQQVEIEARVVAANRSFARDIGTQFAFATSAVNGKNVFGGASAVGQSPVVRSSPPTPIPPLIFGTPPAPPTPSPTGAVTPVNTSMPLSTNLAAQAATSGITYLFSSPNFALDYIITAAETKGVGKLLSKPKIITQNNKKGIVKQGTKIPIQTVVNNTISVQFIDAVLKLEVTPQITADGSVFMDVLVENTQIDPSITRVNGIPALDTQSAESQVLLADGATVVIGGIIISSQRTDISQVPLFGSIPLLGHLFKRTTVQTSSQELLFFLTPRILPT